MIQNRISPQDGVVAEPHEIQSLHHYLESRRLQRSFPKAHETPIYKNLFSTTPYRFLRSQWGWAIGTRAIEVLDAAWKSHELSLSETRPSRLRPCLLRAFLVATQSAESREIQDKLKKSLRAFEGNFFSLLSTREANEDCRFTLLSHLRKGLEDDLLFELQSVDGKNPSQKLDRPSDLALTQLEFDHACRHKNWVQACEKMRVLRKRSITICLRDLTKICAGLERENSEAHYQASVLKELALNRELDLKKRRLYAQRAWNQMDARRVDGKLEITILQLFGSKQLIWRQAFNRLYKNVPMSHRWKRDFHAVGQKSSVLRRKCRTLFDMLRYSKDLARHSLRQNQEQSIKLRAQAVAKFGEVSAKIRRLNATLGPESFETDSLQNELSLSPPVLDTLRDVCSALSLKGSLKLLFNPEILWLESWTEENCVSVVAGTEFLNSDESEQSFLLARVLYREMSGLEGLERRNQDLASMKTLLHKAIAYADWHCHEVDDLLVESRKTHPLRESAIDLLRELYRETDDEYFRQLAECLSLGGWCPSEEGEADRFACSYSDVVSASHALVKEAFGRNNVGQLSLEEGLGSLINSRKLLPLLCLRLQRLWCSFLSL